MIEGTVINLRAVEAADAARVQGWMNDRETARFVGERYLRSLASEEDWLAAYSKQPMSYGNVVFSIETKDALHIGTINLRKTSPEDRKAELAMMIGEKSHWSHGYGSDALRTLLRFAFEEMNLNRVHLTVFDFNERAQACYRKCGFVAEGRMRQALYVDGAYHDIVVMSVLRDEFAAISETASAEVAR